MPKEIFPSSYLCDCGRQVDFCETTIRQIKRHSFRQRSVLAEAPEGDEHRIVFEDGQMVNIICPRRKPEGGRVETRTKVRSSPSPRCAPPSRGKRLSEREGKPASHTVEALTPAMLNLLVEEATVDAQDEDEQAMGFQAIIDSELELPFTIEVLGVQVQVVAIDLTDSGELVAVCEKGARTQRLRLVDLPLPDPPPRGAQWIAAYRHFRRER